MGDPVTEFPHLLQRKDDYAATSSPTSRQRGKTRQKPARSALEESILSKVSFSNNANNETEESDEIEGADALCDTEEYACRYIMQGDMIMEVIRVPDDHFEDDEPEVEALLSRCMDTADVWHDKMQPQYSSNRSYSSTKSVAPPKPRRGEKIFVRSWKQDREDERRHAILSQFLAVKFNRATRAAQSFSCGFDMLASRSSNDATRLGGEWWQRPATSGSFRDSGSRTQDKSFRNALLDLQFTEITPEHYELLLLLDESVAPKGLKQDAINALPRETAVQEVMCTVCMDHIARGSALTRLTCGHEFHTQCIKQWFESSCRCPVDNLPIE